MNQKVITRKYFLFSTHSLTEIMFIVAGTMLLSGVNSVKLGVTPIDLNV